MVLKEHLLQAGHRVEEQYPGELLLHTSKLRHLLLTLPSLLGWQSVGSWQVLLVPVGPLCPIYLWQYHHAVQTIPTVVE